MGIYQRYIKRIIDLIISLLFLPIFILVYIIVGIFIYAEDQGSILYVSNRRGLHGDPFKIYKFRSMKENAPDIRNKDNSTFNADDDPRVTRVGKVLRSTSIDELPQFLNVLKGDMSIIGPRPTMATRKKSELLEKELKRCEVKPGITGYSQAYYRNSITAREKLENDLYYVDHISFGLDVKIFFQTDRKSVV